MENSLQNLIRTSKIFSSLDEEVCKRMLPHFTEITLKQEEVLFYQGDPSDSVFLLAHGKLCAVLTTATGETRILGNIEPGESVGEAGALTNEPRSLTTKAVKNSVLFRLPSKYFLEICHQFPSVMFAVIHPVIMRSREVIQKLTLEKKIKHIVIIPANKNISLQEFSVTLSSYAINFKNLTIISEHTPPSDNKAQNEALLRDEIHLLERNTSQKILYIVKSCDSQLAQLCFKKANMIYIAAEVTSTFTIDADILEKISKRRNYLYSDPDLILLHPANTNRPNNTSLWLSQTHFNLHHHVRANSSKDMQRLLRFIRGKAVGLVLSGGGTRGWAHLGVIKALREAKIPIDIIGGTSVGAIVAGCYAISESYKDAYNRFNRLVELSTGAISWRHLTWPVISLFSAQNFTDAQRKIFENYFIEDLWLPYFAISCNMASNTEEIHREGLLWQITRASSSMPGLIPPMVIDGEMHLDGGLLNNLPIDIMRRMVGDKGKIYGVDLNNLSKDRIRYHFPPALTFKQILLSKLKMPGHVYKFPRFAETFARGLFVGSVAKSKQNSLAANTMINLNLSKFRLLHANSKQADRLIEIGYDETMKQLQHRQKLDEGSKLTQV